MDLAQRFHDEQVDVSLIVVGMSFKAIVQALFHGFNIQIPSTGSIKVTGSS